MNPTYKKTTYTLDNGKTLDVITRITEDESFSIPNDPANRHYAEYLRYTAWVEAGNNPENFWSQSEDFLDTSVSEVSEPKEEGEG